MVDYKVLAQPSAIQSGDTRDNVYYPQIVNLSTLNTRGLIQAMMNLGSTAFSMGEYLGVASDLGSAIAQMLITGHKVNLEGLGMFTPKIETSQKNIKEASAINSSNFSCTVTFTPASEFMTILNSVVWNRVQVADPGQSSSNAFTVTLTNPAPGTLKFAASKSGALQGFPAAGESISIDGAAVAASNIRYDANSGNVYVYNVAGGRHTVALTVGSSRGFEAYSNTWNNVAVAGSAESVQTYIYNQDEYLNLLRISVNGGTALEGGESSSRVYPAGQEITLTMTAPDAPSGNTYRITYMGSATGASSNDGVEAYVNGSWVTVPDDYENLVNITKSQTITQKVRFNVAGTINISLEQVSSGSGDDGTDQD